MMKKILVAGPRGADFDNFRQSISRLGYEGVPAHDAEGVSEVLAGEPPSVTAVLHPGNVELAPCLEILSRTNPVYILGVGASDTESVPPEVDDMLVIPCSDAELQRRLRLAARIVRLQSALSEQLQELETGLLQIQESFLLGECPRDVKGVAVAATRSQRPSVQHFYDFYRHTDHCMDVAVGSVEEEGMQGALRGAATTTDILRVLNELMAYYTSYPPPEPRAIVRRVLERASEHSRNRAGVSLIYSRFDLDLRRVTTVQVGNRLGSFRFEADSGRIRHFRGVPCREAEADRADCVREVRHLAEGDVFLFTAGMPMAEAYRDEVMSVLGNMHRNDPGELIQALRRGVARQTEYLCPLQDLTSVVLRILPEPLAEDSAEMEVTSDPRNLAEIRKFMRSFCARIRTARVHEDDVNRLELAIHEAAINVMHHAYSDQTDQPLLVRLQESGGKLVIKIFDRGRTFDPGDVPAPSFDGTRDGGFGVYLIAQTVDSVRYERDERGRNCMTLVKNLTSQEEA